MNKIDAIEMCNVIGGMRIRIYRKGKMRSYLVKSPARNKMITGVITRCVDKGNLKFDSVYVTALNNLFVQFIRP